MVVFDENLYVNYPAQNLCLIYVITHFSHARIFLFELKKMKIIY